jgi:hypothetical protein
MGKVRSLTKCRAAKILNFDQRLTPKKRSSLLVRSFRDEEKSFLTLHHEQPSRPVNIVIKPFLRLQKFSTKPNL